MPITAELYRRHRNVLWFCVIALAIVVIPFLLRSGSIRTVKAVQLEGERFIDSHLRNETGKVDSTISEQLDQGIRMFKKEFGWVTGFSRSGVLSEISDQTKNADFVGYVYTQRGAATIVLTMSKSVDGSWDVTQMSAYAGWKREEA
jgi:hypothetical protein